MTSIKNFNLHKELKKARAVLEIPEPDEYLHETDKVLRGMGRPTDYSPAYAKVVIDLLTENNPPLSQAKLAFMLQKSASTIRLWERKHPEFSAAMDMHALKGLTFYEDRMLLVATGRLKVSSQMIQFGYRVLYKRVYGEELFKNEPLPGDELPPAEEMAIIDTALPFDKIPTDRKRAMLAAMEKAMTIQ